MIITQYLHFPKGNGSYTVAENLSKNFNIENKIWSIGDNSSKLYTNSNFPVWFSHPKSKNKRFENLSQVEFNDYYNQIKDKLKKLNTDTINIVHHGSIIGSILYELNKKYITYLHGTEMLAYQNVPHYIKKKMYEGFKNSTRIITMSKPQKKEIEKILNKDLKIKIDIIGGGIDTKIFKKYNNKQEIYKKYNLDPNKTQIMFAGRLTIEKGLEELIETFTDKKFSKDKQLNIIGSGNQYNNLTKLTYQKNKITNIQFIPAIPQRELAKLMSACDLFILPSHYESFGLVAIEALACQTPVVASDVGILKEIIKPNKGGEIFKRIKNNKYQTIENIKKAINKALKYNKNTIKEYSKYIHQNYSWKSKAKKLEKVINEEYNLTI